MIVCLSVCLFVFTWQKIDQAGGPDTFLNLVWPKNYILSWHNEHPPYLLAFCRAIGDSWEGLKEQFRRGTDDLQATVTLLETESLQPLKRTVIGELEGKFKQARLTPVYKYTLIIL